MPKIDKSANSRTKKVANVEVKMGTRVGSDHPWGTGLSCRAEDSMFPYKL
jgi:hypothetical protein